MRNIVHLLGNMAIQGIYRRKGVIGSGMGLLIALLLLLMSHFGLFGLDAWELKDVDMRFKIRAMLRLGDGDDERIVLVLIDEATVQAYGEWPLGRDVHTALIDALSRSGAAVIGYDVFFTDPDREHPEYDDLLGAVTEEAGTVCHAVVFSLDQATARNEHEGSPEDLASFSSAFSPHETETTSNSFSRIFSTSVRLTCWSSTERTLFFLPGTRPDLKGCNAQSSIRHLLTSVDDQAQQSRHLYLIALMGVSSMVLKPSFAANLCFTVILPPPKNGNAHGATRSHKRPPGVTATGHHARSAFGSFQQKPRNNGPRTNGRMQ